MIAVLQRVNNATVYADGEFSGSIEKGLYILLGVDKNDDNRDAELLAEKISKLRIFCDENGKRFGGYYAQERQGSNDVPWRLLDRRGNLR